MIAFLLVSALVVLLSVAILSARDIRQGREAGISMPPAVVRHRRAA